MAYNVHVSTVVQVSAEKAFQAFSVPETLNRWFTTEAKVDLIAGGRFSNGDGDTGEYLEVIPQKLLHSTWDRFPEAELLFQFVEKAPDQTEVTIQHLNFGTQEDKDKLQNCWGKTLQAAKSFLES